MNPVHNKLSVGGAGGSLLGAVTWALVTFIPAWHNGLPPQLVTALPVFVGLAGFAFSGWLAKDDTRFTAATPAREVELRLLELLAGQLPPKPLEPALDPSGGVVAPSAAAGYMQPGTMGHGLRLEQAQQQS